MLYEGIVIPTALYGAETWGLREAGRRKLDVFEMGYLRSICGLMWNRVRCEEESAGGKAIIWLSGSVCTEVVLACEEKG